MLMKGAGTSGTHQRRAPTMLPDRCCLSPANALLIGSPCAVHGPCSRAPPPPASRPDLAAAQALRLGNPMAPDRMGQRWTRTAVLTGLLNAGHQPAHMASRARCLQPGLGCRLVSRWLMSKVMPWSRTPTPPTREPWQPDAGSGRRTGGPPVSPSAACRGQDGTALAPEPTRRSVHPGRPACELWWRFALLSASAGGATTPEAGAAAERIPGLDLAPPKEVRT